MHKAHPGDSRPVTTNSRIIILLLITLAGLHCGDKRRNVKAQCDLSMIGRKKTIHILWYDLWQRTLKNHAVFKIKNLPAKKKANRLKTEKLWARLLKSDKTVDPTEKYEASKKGLQELDKLAQGFAKHYHKGVLKIPAFTEALIIADSYCLNSSAAGPTKHEKYRARLQKKNNQVKLLLEGLWDKNFSQDPVQTIIWNLTSHRHQRDLPRRQRKILARAGLISADSVEVFGLEEVLFKASSAIFGRLIVNTMENFSALDSEIVNRKSELPEPAGSGLSCIGPLTIGIEKTKSYSTIEMRVYNGTNKSQPFKMTDIYFKPLRKDVQPLAVELSRYTSLLLFGVLHPKEEDEDDDE